MQAFFYLQPVILLNNHIQLFRCISLPTKFYTLNYASQIPKITRPVEKRFSVFGFKLECDSDFQIQYDSEGSGLIDNMQ
jgi:hypothetical protein